MVEVASFLSVGVGCGMLLRLVVDGVASVWSTLYQIARSI